MTTRSWHNSWIHEFMNSWLTISTPHISIKIDLRNLPKVMSILDDELWVTDWKSGTDNKIMTGFMNSWIHEFMTDYAATPHISIKTDLRNLPKGMSMLDDELWVNDWKSGNDIKILTWFMNSWIHDWLPYACHNIPSVLKNEIEKIPYGNHHHYKISLNEKIAKYHFVRGGWELFLFDLNPTPISQQEPPDDLMPPPKSLISIVYLIQVQNEADATSHQLQGLTV